MSTYGMPEDRAFTEQIEQMKARQVNEPTYQPEQELQIARCAIVRALKGLEQAGKLTPQMDERLNKIWSDLYFFSRDLEQPEAQAYE